MADSEFQQSPSFFLRKVRLQDFGSRRIKQFPIDCTLLLKNIFQKKICNFFLSPQRATQKFSKFFKKKWKYKILDLGKSNNFLSIEPYFFFPKKSSSGAFLGPLGAPKALKILVNENKRVMYIRQGIFQDQIQAD